MKYFDWKAVYIDKTLADWFASKSFKELKPYLGKLDNITMVYMERRKDTRKNRPILAYRRKSKASL